MKVRRLDRRTYNAFNTVDPSGYIVRFERSRNGSWFGKPDVLLVLCSARTLKHAKRLVNEGIQFHLEDADWEVPKPEREAFYASR
jgi:hypothetical protein